MVLFINDIIEQITKDRELVDNRISAIFWVTKACAINLSHRQLVRCKKSESYSSLEASTKFFVLLTTNERTLRSLKN